MDNALPIYFILTYPLAFVRLQLLTQIRWTCLTACPLGYIPIAKAMGFTAQFGNPVLKAGANCPSPQYHFENYLSAIAAMPGRTLPSKNSRVAPPPVEIWEIWSDRPVFFRAAMESPPPTMEVAPFLVASATA